MELGAFHTYRPCETHLTESECETHANNLLGSMTSFYKQNNGDEIPGCYLDVSNFVALADAKMYFNSNFTSGRTCAESIVYTCFCARGPIEISFGFSRITACEGTNVTVMWNGNHDIVEADNADCKSSTIAYLSPPQPDGHEETFTNFGAEPGHTRFFRSSTHCGVDGLDSNRFEVSCPA